LARQLGPLLDRQARGQRLDFIALRAPAGRLVARNGRPLAPGEREAAPPGAGNTGDATGIELLQPGQQEVLPPALRPRVAVTLLPTRNAEPTGRQVEDRAMVLLSTHEVRAPDGRLLGRLCGGVLLNRNLPFIDHINQIVYPPGSLPFAPWGSRGTATLFLDDVRISTNVRLFAGAHSGDRAIGTRVSRDVREAVLGRGQTWLGRAFVVDNWYVSGYEPLADRAGRRVGMLYVGLLERPFREIKIATLAVIGALFAGVMLVAAAVSLRWARTIFGPLERMEATMRRVQDGALHARVGPVAGGDEIGRLAGHLDGLLQTIEHDTRRLQRWNAELDAQVAERTGALEQAQRRLRLSEKLATVGQLTASIAHEINNPIAVIQGNLDLVRELLGSAAAEVGPELALIDGQIERMRLIVTQLLQYARPAEFPGYVEAVDTAALLEDCLRLARHQVAGTGLTVQCDCRAMRRPAINRHELQQVLVNLLVNALQAMPGGGTLSLASADVGEQSLEIRIADTGPGLPAALLPRLFEPFVSGRAGGTGLGLWISRTLVERYGGDITAANGPGPEGAVFTVRLPTASGAGAR
ncbi:MAG: cache domain-containing protein, partial [Burkholderiales bacterium]|nr:cache domain-containing protein [Burkholderiales bacterium]